MKSKGASEEDLKAVRSTPNQKKKLLDSFSKERRESQKKLDASVVSINPDDVDYQPLLQGDADEELRQADRLHEKKINAAEGKMKRVTANDIR